MNKLLKNFLIFLVCLITPIVLYSQENNNQNVINQDTNTVIFKIITNPDDAEVYINNKLIGISPLKRLRANKGTYSIKIYKDNYKLFTTKIKVTENNQVFNFDLKKLPWEPDSNNFTFKYFIPFFSDLEKDIKSSFFFSYKYFFPIKHPLSNFDFEIEVGMIYMRLYYTKDGVPSGGNTSLTIVPLSLNFHFNLFRKFPWISPYIGVGFGTTIINIAAEGYEKTSLTASVMTGLNFFTQSPVSFQVEIRYIWLGYAKIPINGTGSTITDRDDYNFRGIIFNASLVVRF